MSLRTELVVAAATVVFPALVLCALSFLLLSAGSSRSGEAAEETRLESAASTALLRDIGTMERLGRRSIVSGTQLETALERSARRISVNLGQVARFDEAPEHRSAREAAAPLALARDDLVPAPARAPAARLRRETAFDAHIDLVRSATLGLSERRNANYAPSSPESEE